MKRDDLDDLGFRISQHARQRADQRNYRSGDAELIAMHGSPCDGNVFEFTKKDLEPFLRLVGKRVCLRDDTITTVLPLRRNGRKKRRGCASEGCRS